MEVQLTDFENAAFSIFIVLLTRAILSFDLNFYMPISQVRSDLACIHGNIFDVSYFLLSQVDINMQRAQRRDAARKDSFFFRRSIFPRGHELPHDEFESYPPSPRVSPTHGSGEASFNANSADSVSESTSRCSSPTDDKVTNGSGEHVCDEMTMNEIINGTVSPALTRITTMLKGGRYTSGARIPRVTRCSECLSELVEC